MSFDHYQTIIRWTQALDLREICGFVIGHGNQVMGVCLVENINRDATRAFYMNPAQLLRMLMMSDSSGYELIGIFHSHPPGTPLELSERDNAGCIQYRNLYNIIFTLSFIGSVNSITAFQFQGSDVSKVPVIITYP